jgi:hypothetical protein
LETPSNATMTSVPICFSTTVLLDPHVPSLLVFPPKTDLHDHELVKNGHVILQVGVFVGGFHWQRRLPLPVTHGNQLI